MFHVLSAPTIWFYKAVPPLSPIHFPSLCLSFHPIPSLAFSLFSSSFFTLSFSLSLYPSFTLSLFLFLSIFYSPCSHLCLYSDLLLHLSSVVSCSQHAPHPSLRPHFLLFLFTMPSLSYPFNLLIFAPFPPFFTSHFLACPVLREGTCNTQNTCTDIQYTQTRSHAALALLPSHQDKGVWGKLITNLRKPRSKPVPLLAELPLVCVCVCVCLCVCVCVCVCLFMCSCLHNAKLTQQSGLLSFQTLDLLAW